MKGPPQSEIWREGERALSKKKKKKISFSAATFQSVFGKVAAAVTYPARQPTDGLTYDTIITTRQQCFLLHFSSADLHLEVCQMAN